MKKVKLFLKFKEFNQMGKTRVERMLYIYTEPRG